MPKPKKLFAVVVSRVVSLDTGAHVGWVYHWNDGTFHVSWLNDPPS